MYKILTLSYIFHCFYKKSIFIQVKQLFLYHMIAKIFISGIIGADTTLLDVIRQFKSYNNPASVEVFIDSPGGGVDEGNAIFGYLSKLNIPVTTVAIHAYSIAATIFMAGDTRKVISGPDRFMIHLPWSEAQGTADQFEKTAKELRKIEQEFQEFYSNFTNIDKDTILNLLKKETFLSGEQALELGFATELEEELKAVAFYTKSENQNKKEMNKLDKILTILTNAFGKSEEVKALVLQDATGQEIEFPDVEEGQLPEIGDRALIDGQPAEGEFVSPDGETWVFVGGELTEVREAEETIEEEEVAEEQEEVEASAEEQEEVEEEIFLSEDETLQLQETFKTLLEAFELEIMNKVAEKFKNENDELKAEILALKKLVGSEDVDIQAQERNSNTRKNTKGANYLTSIIRG